MIEIGPNLKEIILAIVALIGTIAGYYFGFKRGYSGCLKALDNQNKK